MVTNDVVFEAIENTMALIILTERVASWNLLGVCPDVICMHGMLNGDVCVSVGKSWCVCVWDMASQSKSGYILSVGT